MNTLIEDILNIIFKQSNNINCILVCKQWYKIILQSSIICNTCNKFTQIYGHTYWITDKNNEFCCGYYGNSLEDYTIIMKILKECPNFIKKVNCKSIGIWYDFIKENGWALEYITNQNDKICLAAVKNNPSILKYVKKQTHEICLEAIKQDGTYLEYTEDKFKTEEIILKAVETCKYALQFINSNTMTNDLYEKILKINGEALQYFGNKTDEEWLEIIKIDSICFHYIQNKTEKLCLEAIKLNGDNIYGIINPTKEMYFEAYKQNTDYATMGMGYERFTENTVIDCYKLFGGKVIQHMNMYSAL